MAKESLPFRNGILGNKPKYSYRRVASTNVWLYNENILFPIDFPFIA